MTIPRLLRWGKLRTYRHIGCKRILCHVSGMNFYIEGLAIRLDILSYKNYNVHVEGGVHYGKDGTTEIGKFKKEGLEYPSRGVHV